MNILKNTPNFYPICTKCCEINEWLNYFENICIDLNSSICQDCEGKVVLIDSLFLEISNILWKKNYITENSCLGHPQDQYSSIPYISFKGDCKFKDLPLGWYIDNMFYKTVLRCSDKNKIYYNELISWAKSLPENKQIDNYVKNTKLTKREYNKNLIFFLGKNSLQKNQELLNEKIVWVKEPKELTKISTENTNNLIIDASLFVNLELEPLLLTQLVSNKKIIICFNLKSSLEESYVPTGISGWGAFLNKKQYELYRLWLGKYRPSILTGNFTNIFNVYY